MPLNSITSLFRDKRIALLGFGREGRAMLRFIRRELPGKEVYIADANPFLNEDPSLREIPGIQLQAGPDYLEGLHAFDLVIKTPGIPHSLLNGKVSPQNITTQTDLFLRRFAPQVTGITGTKGKSTTSSLISHLLKSAGKDTVLLGNIGIPAFDLWDHIGPHTHIVFELSSHQLEDIHISPHIALLLNIFEEHLDHYPSFEAYQQAKLNIARFQQSGDYFVFHSENPVLREAVAGNGEFPGRRHSYTLCRHPGSSAYWRGNDLVVVMDGREVLLSAPQLPGLPGDHNRLNIAAACLAAMLNGLGPEEIISALPGFQPLPHRMEYVGCLGNIHFYNDSIATIPEATMAAVKSLGKVDTLIAGGHNRGIHYGGLVDFLLQSGISLVLLTGEVGNLLLEGLQKGGFSGKAEWDAQFENLVKRAVSCTPHGGVCLLSPAASSYDAFRNFEERGDLYKNLVKDYFASLTP